MLALVGVILYLVVLGLVASLAASAALINLGVFPEPPLGHWGRRLLIKRIIRITSPGLGGSRLPAISVGTRKTFGSVEGTTLGVGERAHVPWPAPWALSSGQTRALREEPVGAYSPVIAPASDALLLARVTRFAEALATEADLRLYGSQVIWRLVPLQGEGEGVDYVSASGTHAQAYRLLDGVLQ